MPNLIIIASCNGAGKSTFASSLLPTDIISFDFDKLFIENYNSLPDSELREKFAKDKTTNEFEQVIKSHIFLSEKSRNCKTPRTNKNRIQRTFC